MKREQFINYLLHPEELKGESAVALNSLLKEFPYFQSAQLLYLKTLHNEKSIHYQSQLKIAAAYSANRKSLYFLINGEPAKKENPEKSGPLIPVKETEVLETLEVQAALEMDQVGQTAVPLPVEQTSPQVEDKESINEAPALVEASAEEDIPAIGEQAAVVTPNREAPLTSPEEKKLDGLDSAILAEAISAGVSMELSAMEILPVETKREEEVPEVKVKEQEERGELPKQENHSFIEWLKLSQGQKMEPQIPLQQEPAFKPKVEEKRALIEKFITTEPRIVPKKQEFYNPVNKARQSVMENDSIVSETLAQVYLKQGNFQRALKSYEILSLKFPEKSSYFAAQILKIKELQQERK
ncbi:MAG: hypothetical protein ABUT20_36045 [Bacteroidota bacterium]